MAKQKFDGISRTNYKPRGSKRWRSLGPPSPEPLTTQPVPHDDLQTPVQPAPSKRGGAREGNSKPTQMLGGNLKRARQEDRANGSSKRTQLSASIAEGSPYQLPFYCCRCSGLLGLGSDFLAAWCENCIAPASGAAPPSMPSAAPAHSTSANNLAQVPPVTEEENMDPGERIDMLNRDVPPEQFKLRLLEPVFLPNGRMILNWGPDWKEKGWD